MSFLQTLDQFGLATNQNHGEAYLDFTGVTVFLLPGAMFQPESLAGDTGRSNRCLFETGDNADQLAVIAVGNQLEASSFSLDFASGETSGMAR